MSLTGSQGAGTDTAHGEEVGWSWGSQPGAAVMAAVPSLVHGLLTDAHLSVLCPSLATPRLRCVQARYEELESMVKCVVTPSVCGRVSESVTESERQGGSEREREREGLPSVGASGVMQAGGEEGLGGGPKAMDGRHLRDSCMAETGREAAEQGSAVVEGEGNSRKRDEAQAGCRQDAVDPPSRTSHPSAAGALGDAVGVVLQGEAATRESPRGQDAGVDVSADASNAAGSDARRVRGDEARGTTDAGDGGGREGGGERAAGNQEGAAEEEPSTAGDEPAGEEPAGEAPAVEAPAGEAPAGGEPAGGEPAAASDSGAREDDEGARAGDKGAIAAGGGARAAVGGRREADGGAREGVPDCAAGPTQACASHAPGVGEGCTDAHNRSHDGGDRVAGGPIHMEEIESESLNLFRRRKRNAGACTSICQSEKAATEAAARAVKGEM